MENKDNKTVKEGLIQTGVDYLASTANSTVGALIGGAILGPAGAALGAIAGTTVQKVLETIGNEIQKRALSTSEAKKVGTAYSLTQKFIEEKLNNNRKLRNDDFFQNKVNDRSPAEEILEGTILAAQREFEERKIVYMSKMYANIVFSPEISREMANYLIKLAEQMTYRQIIILQSIGIAKFSFPPMSLQKTAYNSVSGISNVAIAAEIFDLYRMSILTSSYAILDSAGINPSALSIGGYGAHLFNLMELRDTSGDNSDTLAMRKDIFSFLTGKANQKV